MLRALDFHLSGAREVALVAPEGGEGLDELAAVVRSALHPRLVLAGGPEGCERPELLAGRSTVDGHAAAYVCEDFSCRAPVTGPERLAAALGR
jgi:uncharacterized protein YyaL (SSP411 family)